MQNVAYRIEVGLDENAPSHAEKSTGCVEICAACGEQLFGRDAEACSWQAWGTFWEILGMSNVALVCGACGEYLQGFFHDPN